MTLCVLTHLLLLAKEGQSVKIFVHFSINSYAVACKWKKSKHHSFFLCCQDYNCRTKQKHLEGKRGLTSLYAVF